MTMKLTTIVTLARKEETPNAQLLEMMKNAEEILKTMKN